jgi:hypothetical protein
MAGRNAFTSCPVGIFTALITGLIDVGALYLAATSEERRLLNLVLGAFMLSVAAMVVLGQRRSVTTWEQAQLQQRPAWSMRIGERGQVPAVALVCTTLGLGFALGAALGDNPAVAVLCAVLALFMLVLAVEFWRVMLRRPELRISADLIQLHGPGIDSELGWDDVGAVVHEHLGTRWGALVITATRDASSYRWKLSRLLLPMDREPDPPGIHLRFGLIPDEAQLRRILRDMHVGDRAAREAMISRGLPADSGY